MTSKSATLILPGLLPLFLNDLPSNVPLLKKMLSRASLQKGNSFEHSLKTLFHGLGHGAFHEGIFGAYSQGLVTSPLSETWCRVDFLACQIDTQAVYAQGCVVLESSENQALAQTFIPFFEEVGLLLHVAPNGEWYLAVPHHTDVVMNNVLSMLGKNLAYFLPSGPDQAFWRRLWTECQMVLATHPVNIKRRENQQPEIACLWFEGLGKIKGPVSTSVAHVCTTESSIQGLAKWAGVSFSEGLSDDKPLVVIDRLFYRYLKQHQHAEFLRALIDCENHWFAPLHQALMKKQIDTIIIDDANGRQFCLKPRNQHYFWRTLKPLSAFTQEYI